jgi:NRPS condensation-like uncharacterized protein
LNEGDDSGSLGGIAMLGRFNIFQRTMLLWDDMHAYNAVHVAKIPAVCDRERLQRTLGSVLEGRGITGLWIDARNRDFEYRGGPASVELEFVAAGGNPAESLRAEIERQINTRFARDVPFTPFRCFALQDGAAFWLGVAYFHAVADAESVVRLLGEFVEDYLSDAPAKRECWERHSRIVDRRPWRPGLWLRKLMVMGSQLRAMRRSNRPYCSDFDDSRNAVELFNLGSEDLAKLKAASRASGVTLNDLFLALLMRALAPMALAQRRPGRELLALGCIVNARRDLGEERPDVFGLALGSFTVAHGSPEAGGIAELAGEMFRQTRRLKQGGLYLANSLELRLTLRLLSFFSTNWQRRFYAKNYPLWGGVTNMNLSDFQKRSPTTAPTDYLRAVSTGPATPLVLSLTTFGGRVNCSITYRTSFFSAEQIATARERFQAAVRGLGAQA